MLKWKFKFNFKVNPDCIRDPGTRPLIKYPTRVHIYPYTPRPNINTPLHTQPYTPTLHKHPYYYKYAHKYKCTLSMHFRNCPLVYHGNNPQHLAGKEKKTKQNKTKPIHWKWAWSMAYLVHRSNSHNLPPFSPHTHNCLWVIFSS